MNAATGPPKRSNSPLNTSAKQYVERWEVFYLVYYNFYNMKYMFREPIREPRRVGSGRLMSRDSWDSGYRQSENGIANNYTFGKGGFRETSHNSMLVF